MGPNWECAACTFLNPAPTAPRGCACDDPRCTALDESWRCATCRTPKPRPHPESGNTPIIALRFRIYNSEEEANPAISQTASQSTAPRVQPAQRESTKPVKPDWDSMFWDKLDGSFGIGDMKLSGLVKDDGQFWNRDEALEMAKPKN